MPTEEHKLTIAMFGRINEAIGASTETLKSREIWVGDDSKAFREAVHSYPVKMVGYIVQAGADYLRTAKQLGVETGIDNPPPI
jgi:hypothetical protein